MEKHELNLLGPALRTYLVEFADLASAPTLRLIEAYLRGQLGPLHRKSVVPLAKDAGIAPRTLQELLSLHRWDENLLIQRLQERVLRLQAGPDAVAALIETAHRKKGTRTPGVDLQRSEPDGRMRRCVATLHLGYSAGDLHCLLDNAIYLPKSWTDSPEKKATARIPDRVVYRPKSRIALEMLDRARANGFRFGWVYCGPDLASDEQFVQDVRARGAGVVSDRPYRLNGKTLSSYPGPLTSDDSSDASPANVLRAARAGEKCLEVFDRYRREIGLDHFEVRTYQSLVRHLVLSCASILFLAEQALRVPPRRQTSAVVSRAL